MTERPLLIPAGHSPHVKWPIYNFRPPLDTFKRKEYRAKGFVYGFPVPYEWLRQQYQLYCEIAKPENDPDDDFPQLRFDYDVTQELVTKCREIWPGGPMIYVSTVTTSGYWDGGGLVLAVGKLGNHPPLDIAFKMRDELESYGLLDGAAWFPIR